MVVVNKSEKVPIAVFDYLVQTGWSRNLVLDFIGTYMQQELPLLVVKNLSYHAGRHQILEQVTFDVLPGEILGIIGDTGSGKSTLLHVLAGLLKPHSGVINLRSDTTKYSSLIKNKAMCHRTVGLALQNPSLYDELTVEENLLHIGALYDLDYQQSRLQAESVLELLELNNEKEQRVSTLPHAKRKIVDIALALMNSPQLLLLDNPTEGLDDHSTKKVLKTIHEINQKGITIVMVSSKKRDVEQVASRIAKMTQKNLHVLSTLPMIDRKNMYTFRLQTKQRDYFPIQGYLDYAGAQNVRQEGSSLLWETQNPEHFLQEISKQVTEHAQQVTELSCEPLIGGAHEGI